MNTQDIIEFNINNNKILLDMDEDELSSTKSDRTIFIFEKIFANPNEWFQEYELIYQSYILEK
jgi:hypothetical protein